MGTGYVSLQTASGSIVLSGSSPSAPSNLVLNPISATRIDGTYTPSGSVGAVHKLTYTPTGGSSTTVTVSGGVFSITGLTGNTTYAFSLVATNFFGTSSAVTGSATTPNPGAPSAPTNMTAEVVPGSASEIALAWDGVSTVETSLTIERKLGGGAYATLVTFGAGENVYIDRSCAAGSTYTYRVRGSNVSGTGNPSNEASATTGAAYSSGKPNDPTGLTVTAATATTANISFTNNATGNYTYRCERRGPSTLEYAVIKGLGTATSFTDVGLTPGATYTYRVRATSTATANPTNYTSEVSVTMPSRTAGLPVEPSNVLAVPASSTSITVTWANNDGTNPQFEVYYALWNAGLSNSFTLFTTTAGGATSATVTGLTAENPYRIRVRAKNGSGFSDYGVPLNEEQLRMAGPECATNTCSPGTGGNTYNVGPGQTYTTPGAFFNANTLAPGDTVNIFPTMSGSTVVPYSDCVLMSYRGKPGSRITIQGQPDPTFGKYPIWNVSSGTATTDFGTRAAAIGSTFAPGALWLGRRSGMTFGYSPGYITIKLIEFTGAYTGGSYVRSGPTTVNWNDASAGIYVEAVEDLVIDTCTVDGNGNGIFAAALPTYDRPIYDVTLQFNSIFNNSGTTPSGTPSHNTYIEGIRVTYHANLYGAIRTGGQGIGLKERSSGAVIRYNSISGGNHQCEHAEAQNSADLAVALVAARKVYIYGNITYTEPGNASSPYWFGGDQGNPQIQTKAIYYAYHNTVVVRNDQTGSPSVFKIPVFQVSCPCEVLDARNNILVIFPNTSSTPSDFGLGVSSLSGTDAGNYVAYFGATWAAINYLLTTGNGYTFTGTAIGQGNILNGPGHDPGFVNESGGDYHLNSNSPCVGIGTALPGDITTNHPPNLQYHSPQSTVSRSTYGLNADLGAYKQGVV